MPLGKKNTPTPPPGRPGNAPPPVDEPTEPTPPLPPKPDQQGAALRTATGTPVGPDGGEQIDPEERDRAQQSAHLTMSGSPSGWCTPAVPPRTESSRATAPPNP